MGQQEKSMNDLELQAVEVMELIEDTVSYYCDEKMTSGELVWTMVSCLAQAKLNQFPPQETD